MRSVRRAWVLAFLLAATMIPANVGVADSHVFLSELHYDNAGTDVGEFFEVQGPAGTDLSGWSVVLYNGNGGTPYDTIDLSSAVIDDEGAGSGAVSVSLPTNGLQNGSPDGLALVSSTSAVVEFLSYEGSFLAVGGPADGMTSTDIGVAESNGTPIGESLQKVAGTWSGPAAESPGSLNAAGPPPPPAPTVFVSELHYDNTGTDVGEAVEITAPAGMDMAGWSIVLYNGSSTQLSPYATVDLNGTVPSGGAFSSFIVGIQNGAPDGLAIIDPTNAVIEFLSYEGSFTAAAGPAIGLTSTDIGVSESSSTLVGESLQKIGGVWTGPAPSTFAEPLVLPPREVKIHDVQGSGGDSPLVGERVIVEGIVVGDFETFDRLAGFFVQEEDTDADADASTSEGVFVFNASNNSVSVGDLVRVEGTVEERFGNTQLTGSVSVGVVSSGNALPSAESVKLPLAASDALEAFEGMLANLPQTLSILEYFNYDRYGEIVVGSERQFQPTAVFEPGSLEAAALAEANALDRITIDDGRGDQNPDPAIHPGNGDEFTLQNRFRGGDTIAGITGPIYFDFGLYRVVPTEFGDFAEANPRPDGPTDVGGDVKVAAFNALNYFLTVDDGRNDICGPDRNMECRGADSETERLRQRAKLLSALEGLDADVVGLVEVENTPGVEPLADLVAGLNDGLGAGTYEYIAAGDESVVGTDAIKVGVIYKPGVVTPIGDTAILDDPSFLDPRSLGDDKNRAALAQSFVENASGEVFSVTVNHLKSKGSGCGAGDDDPLQGSCNLTRTLSAQRLLDWIETSPTGVADDDFLIIGDLNSYDKEDPIGELTAGGFTDLVGAYGGEFAYSYLFDGQLGYLDYAMSSSSMTSQVTGATVWHVNADEPDLIDYDTSFKRDAQDALYEPNAFRSSDHDPVLVGLDLDSGMALTASPDVLWPVDRKLHTVELALSSGGEVSITSVESSELDSTNRGDRGGDVVIVDGDTVMLRAERYSIDGRTYTIHADLTIDGQVRIGATVLVVVPHDQRRSFR